MNLYVSNSQFGYRAWDLSSALNCDNRNCLNDTFGYCTIFCSPKTFQMERGNTWKHVCSSPDLHFRISNRTIKWSRDATGMCSVKVIHTITVWFAQHMWLLGLTRGNYCVNTSGRLRHFVVLADALWTFSLSEHLFIYTWAMCPTYAFFTPEAVRCSLSTILHPSV